MTGAATGLHARSCPKRTGGGLVSRPPKGRSKRIVPLPSELVPVLERHRVEQERERALAGEAWQEHDLVFTQPDGSPVDPRRDWADWKELLAVAGVRDARVHDGRHTAGTLLVEQGVHVRVVQEILGHTDIRITQRYAHASSAAVTDAASGWGRHCGARATNCNQRCKPKGSRTGVGNDEPPAPGGAA